MYALVNETKIIAIPVRPTPRPSRARRKRIAKCGEPQSKRPPPSPPGGGVRLSPREILEPCTDVVVVKLAISFLVRRHGCRVRLHHVIARRARHAVLVRTVVNHGRASSEIVMGRRRFGRPFERRCFPRVVSRLLPGLHAPKQVEQKNE